MSNEFFTAATMFTLMGGSSAVLLVSNTFQKLSNKDPKWVGFIISILLAFAGAYASATGKDAANGSPFGLGDALVALINGCLLFCTAAGINAVTGKPASATVAQGGAANSLGTVKTLPAGAHRRGWNSRWQK